MIPYLGDFLEDATVYMMFNTFTSNDPSASSTITNFVNTDVHIHKDDGLTQRNNAAGITVSVDFDGITGSHMIKIDTSDDTVAAFWVTGSDYFVRIEGTTVDGATINAVVGHFSIENRFQEVDVVKWLGTAAATPTVAGVPEVDLTHIGGATQSATDLKDFADAGYDPATNKVEGVKLSDAITANNDKTGYALSASGIDSIHDEVVEGTITSRQMMRILLAAIAGKSSGGGTTTITFRDNADSKNRITATVTSVGNRTAMTLDGS